MTRRSRADADDGKTFNVTKGQNVLVKLSANPTAGYKWVVASTDRTFGYPATDKFQASSGASGPSARAAPSASRGRRADRST